MHHVSFPRDILKGLSEDSGMSFASIGKSVFPICDSTGRRNICSRSAWLPLPCSPACCLPTSGLCGWTRPACSTQQRLQMDEVELASQALMGGIDTQGLAVRREAGMQVTTPFPNVFAR